MSPLPNPNRAPRGESKKTSAVKAVPVAVAEAPAVDSITTASVGQRHASAKLLRKIVSGGQTGVDLAALDAAIELKLRHGGWCPLGRRSEAGRIPKRYRLAESHSPEYHVRTEQNVVDSDATLILCLGRPLSGGTALTERFAARHDRPLLVVDLHDAPSPVDVCDWLAAHRVKTLNVAGPRESSQPGIYEQSLAFLVRVLRSCSK